MRKRIPRENLTQTTAHKRILYLFLHTTQKTMSILNKKNIPIFLEFQLLHIK